MMKKKEARICLYITSICLLFVFVYSWIFYNIRPPAILNYLLAQVGSSVGMSLTVPENPFNTWAKQLQEKEENLNKREEAILKLIEKSERDSKIILVLVFILSIVLFFFIFLNFYFDYQERKNLKRL